MRDRFLKLLLERALPTRPDEDFFSAGPVGTGRRPNSSRQNALVADLRRQSRRGRHSLAA